MEPASPALSCYKAERDKGEAREEGECDGCLSSPLEVSRMNTTYLRIRSAFLYREFDCRSLKGDLVWEIVFDQLVR
jgi:hypothetical protein